MKKLITRLYKRFFLKKHKFPPTIYIHKKNARVVFEVELNWFDEDLLPVSLLREVKSGKNYSVRYHEMLEFIELRGNKPEDGTEI